MMLYAHLLLFIGLGEESFTISTDKLFRTNLFIFNPFFTPVSDVVDTDQYKDIKS